MVRTRSQTKATGMWEQSETLSWAKITLREPIQAIAYSPCQWRDAERGGFSDEIRRTGRVIYRRSGEKVK